MLTIAALAVSLVAAAPAVAQQAGEQQSDPARQELAQTPPAVAAYDELPYRWNISIGAGTISGATPIGSATDEDAGRITSFEIGNGTLVNARVARRFWWRLGGEFEFGYGSPGIDAMSSDLDGTNVENTAFADYQVTYGAASVRLDLTDARVAPFALLGVAVVSGDSDVGSQTSAGLLFGGGVDIRLHERVYLRGDVKGLRSNVDADGLSRGALVTGEGGDALSTQFLWTAGVAIRF